MISRTRRKGSVRPCLQQFPQEGRGAAPGSGPRAAPPPMTRRSFSSMDWLSQSSCRSRSPKGAPWVRSSRLQAGQHGLALRGDADEFVEGFLEVLPSEAPSEQVGRSLGEHFRSQGLEAHVEARGGQGQAVHALQDGELAFPGQLFRACRRDSIWTAVGKPGPQPASWAPSPRPARLAAGMKPRKPSWGTGSGHGVEAIRCCRQ